MSQSLNYPILTRVVSPADAGSHADLPLPPQTLREGSLAPAVTDMTVAMNTTTQPRREESTVRVLSFDIGGTWVKYGVIDSHGEILFVDQLATRSASDGRALLEHLLAVAMPLVEKYKPSGIAFSTLGIIDAHEGRLVGAVEAISGYFGQSPKESFERAFGLPVIVENDGNCVALAEGWTGSATGVPHYLAIALGTGIGGGVVIDGRLYRGANGAAGEWGYMLIDGKVWEDCASPRGLAQAAERVRPGCGYDAKAVFAARDAGDAQMTEIVAEWFAVLSKGIVNLLYAFNPSRLIVGGGITSRGPAFLQELRLELRMRLRPDFYRMCHVELATAGNHAGLIGAAKLWLLEHGSVSLATKQPAGAEVTR